MCIGPGGYFGFKKTAPFRDNLNVNGSLLCAPVKSLQCCHVPQLAHDLLTTTEGLTVVPRRSEPERRDQMFLQLFQPSAATHTVTISLQAELTTHGNSIN